MQCCQFSTDEELEHEAEVFDCEACPVTAHLDALDVDSRRAWDVAHAVCTRFLGDGHAVGLVLNRMLADLEGDDYVDMIERISLIYDVLVPAPARRQE